MRKINYDQYLNEMKKKSLHIYTKTESTNKAKRSPKLRDPEEDLVLFRLDKLRWQKALDTGRIEKTAPRRYRWNE